MFPDGHHCSKGFIQHSNHRRGTGRRFRVKVSFSCVSCVDAYGQVLAHRTQHPLIRNRRRQGPSPLSTGTVVPTFAGPTRCMPACLQGDGAGGGQPLTPMWRGCTPQGTTTHKIPPSERSQKLPSPYPSTLVLGRGAESCRSL